MRMRISVALVMMGLAMGLQPVQAQFLGAPVRDGFKDTSMLKPPAGSKVAIVVFEDLGCPACAQAHPIELQVAAQTHVPLVRYDFPITSHIWTFDGAVCARYIQDKVSPQLAEEYRSAVFASQREIANKEDLQRFTARWLKQHGQQMPFVLDPGGLLAKKVEADYQLGDRMNLQYTPTIIVVTNQHYQVVCGLKDLTDPSRILPVVEAALAQTQGSAAKGARRAQ
jgi:protein-disulfide isomerase